MKFNSQICTTREQSERLLALGLKAETADMRYILFEGDLEPCIRAMPWNSICIPCQNNFPTWSLHRLIEIANLPQYWECISGNWYEEVIASIQSKIHIGDLNKEYLEERV
jgi:hypothetical protein